MVGVEGGCLLALSFGVSAVGLQGHFGLNDILALIEASPSLDILLDRMFDFQILKPAVVVVCLWFPAGRRHDLC